MWTWISLLCYKMDCVFISTVMSNMLPYLFLQVRAGQVFLNSQLFQIFCWKIILCVCVCVCIGKDMKKKSDKKKMQEEKKKMQEEEEKMRAEAKSIKEEEKVENIEKSEEKQPLQDEELIRKEDEKLEKLTKLNETKKSQEKKRREEVKTESVKKEEENKVTTEEMMEITEVKEENQENGKGKERKKSKSFIKEQHIEEINFVSEATNIITTDGGSVDKQFQGKVTMEVDIDTTMEVDSTEGDTLKITGSVTTDEGSSVEPKNKLNVSSTFSFDQEAFDASENEQQSDENAGEIYQSFLLINC